VARVKAAGAMVSGAVGVGEEEIREACNGMAWSMGVAQCRRALCARERRRVATNRWATPRKIQTNSKSNFRSNLI
jgi:hypothetical protein